MVEDVIFVDVDEVGENVVDVDTVSVTVDVLADVVVGDVVVDNVVVGVVGF